MPFLFFVNEFNNYDKSETIIMRISKKELRRIIREAIKDVSFLGSELDSSPSQTAKDKDDQDFDIVAKGDYPKWQKGASTFSGA